MRSDGVALLVGIAKSEVVSMATGGDMVANEICRADGVFFGRTRGIETDCSGIQQSRFSGDCAEETVGGVAVVIFWRADRGR